ncbi:MAG: hypothetical protein QXP27_05825 [Candidatus Methanomethyliaceae archaeon]
MGKCQFCGKDAGFFRSAHKECKQAYEEGSARILEIASKAALTQSYLPALQETINNVASTSCINAQSLMKLLARAWETAVSLALEDGVLSEDEERSLVAFKDHFSLPTHVLDKNGAYTRVAKAAIIRGVLNGNIPPRVKVEGTLPFNFQKGESLVWLFQNVQYYEPRTRTVYSGGYSGVSIRIAKGVYYRVGGFRGNSVVTTQTVLIDKGSLGITNKHIYFAGNTKSFRVRYDKIVSFIPYSDGIAIQRDASSAKPQIFVTGDGWFTYNLVMNLARLMAA